jgi:very-short-patch-repair endonuclease
MRRLFTADEASRRGISRAGMRWRVQNRRWRKVDRGVFVVGAADPTPLERAVAVVIATGGVASDALAGVLLGLDTVVLRGPVATVPPASSNHRSNVRRRVLPSEGLTTVQGVRCTDGLQTLLDLAAALDDLAWEQALESALRKELTTIEALTNAPSRMPGAARVRRVLALRPEGAPPTESLLETLMVQLAREVPGLVEPTRQLVIQNRHGAFVARVDLAWLELGLFIELDGEHHKGQPVYDASRETAVVASTGWLCGRFTWTEVTRYRRHTIRRLAELAEQARRRPLPVD